MIAGMPRAPVGVVTGVRIHIWSDVVCPWCYIGKRRLEAALSRFEHADRVDVVWHSFELDPGAPAQAEGEYVSRLAAKYGTGIDRARAMVDTMTATGREDGLDLRFDAVRPGNTFDAHRLLHLALDRGVQHDLEERLLRATFTEGRPIGDRATLADLAAEAGLDRLEAEAVLAGDDYAEQVRADEEQAAALRITGVPFFVVDARYGVSGAQPADVLLEVLQRAWSEQAPPLTVVGGGTDDGCADGSCAV